MIYRCGFGSRNPSDAKSERFWQLFIVVAGRKLIPVEIAIPVEALNGGAVS